jgi:hypothetical protein
MLALLLAFVLDGPPRLPVLDTRSNDAFFAVAQEDFVYRAVPVESFRSVLPPDLARLVGCLGCGRHDCRELAQELIAAHPMGLRAAVWGVHAVDPDVAERCLGLLRRFLPCPHCGGDGYCPSRVDGEGGFRPGGGCAGCENAPFDRHPEGGTVAYPDARYEPWQSRCLTCNGTGSLLFLCAPYLRNRED